MSARGAPVVSPTPAVATTNPTRPPGFATSVASCGCLPRFWRRSWLRFCPAVIAFPALTFRRAQERRWEHGAAK